VAVLETRFTAENRDGALTVCSLLDGDVANTNVADDTQLAHRHLRTLTSEVDGDVAVPQTETVTSDIRIAQAARTSLSGATARLQPLSSAAGHRVEIPLTRGRPVSVAKTVATVSSRDVAVTAPAVTARTVLAQAGDPAALRRAHERAWAWLWDRFDTDLDAADATRLAVRLHTYHLLTAVPAHLDDVDAGMGARSLHREGYRSHVFWDELFALPVLNPRQPALAGALLRYRYRRLDQAWAAATLPGRPGHVSLAERQRRPRGNPDPPLQPAHRPVDPGQLPPPAPRRHRRGLQRPAALPGHRRLDVLTTISGELIIEVARCLDGLGPPRSGRRPLPHRRRDGPRRVPRRLPQRAPAKGCATPTPT